VLAFRNVHAFEPSEHRVALGEAEGRVELAVVCGNSGATHVRPGLAGSTTRCSAAGPW